MVGLVFSATPVKRDFAGYSEEARAEQMELRLQQMRAVLAAEGHTFTIGHNPAMQYPLETLCNFKPEMVSAEDYAHEGGEYIDGLDLIQALSSSYTGYYTSVKNQGSCGSCWAFSIVGTTEGRFLKAGSSYNLSEQYQLDCNHYGYSCSGGYFTSHNDHKSPYGARSESCYPYVAYKQTCKTSCGIYKQITSWYYVGSSSGVPSTTAIKQAIYDRGSVGAAVYANSYFQAYTGGCYTRNSSGSPNHAIVLVGWNDANCSGGAWRLKNSWGTGWGESGFMWIKYGYQQVGYAANYVNI
jgi:C1A family cysteine protease